VYSRVLSCRDAGVEGASGVTGQDDEQQRGDHHHGHGFDDKKEARGDPDVEDREQARDRQPGEADDDDLPGRQVHDVRVIQERGGVEGEAEYRGSNRAQAQYQRDASRVHDQVLYPLTAHDQPTAAPAPVRAAWRTITRHIDSTIAATRLGRAA
jgi:hypothetical protein